MLFRSEDPDSPGPLPLPDKPSATAPPQAPTPHPSARDPLADPLAEPLSALLGTGLALLTLTVPLLAVLGEGRTPATGRSLTPQAAGQVLLGTRPLRPGGPKQGQTRSERIDNGAAAGGPTRP